LKPNFIELPVCQRLANDLNKAGILSFEDGGGGELFVVVVLANQSDFAAMRALNSLSKNQ
jgi:hypothetical protein